MLGAWHRVNGDLRALHQAIQGRKADAWSLFHVAAFRSGITKDNLEKGTGDAEWTGWVPFEALPHLYDPPSHVIVTANHRPAPPSYRFHGHHRAD